MRSVTYYTVPQTLYNCLWIYLFFPFLWKTHRHWQRATSQGLDIFLLCHGHSFSAVPGTREQNKKKYITAQKKHKTLSAGLTGEQRPSTSVIHSGSAVRPKLPEPWCSIWEQPVGPAPPPLLPISKLSPSVGRDAKEKTKNERGNVTQKF